MSKVKYCADCGLMRLKYERVCPKCGGTKTTLEKPEPAGRIYHIGLTKMTRYTGVKEII